MKKSSFLSPGGAQDPSKSTQKSLSPRGTAGGTGTGRFENRKVPLAVGKSLMDWMRYSTSAHDLPGTSGKILKVTEEDMNKHASRTSAWTILYDKVYNVTSYLEYHPGGVDQLMRVAGTDGTELFNYYHPWVSLQGFLGNCFVGNFIGNHKKLKPPGPEPTAISAEATCISGSSISGGGGVSGLSLVDGKTVSSSASLAELHFTACKLRKTVSLTSDVKLFVFDMPSTFKQLELPPIGSHVFFRHRLPEDGTLLVRPYTPIIPKISVDEEGDSPDSDQSASSASSNLHFIIKIYPKGALTKRLNTLKPGVDKVDISDARAPFKLDTVAKFRKFYLFAAGTGITPMIRLIDYFVKKVDHETKLYFFNKTERDIVWAKQFDDLSLKAPNFECIHILSQPSDTWKGFKGRISQQLIEKLVNPSKLDFKFAFSFVCGPQAFNLACDNALAKISWPKDRIFIFQET